MKDDARDFSPGMTRRQTALQAAALAALASGTSGAHAATLAPATAGGWSPTRARFSLPADQSITNTVSVFVIPFQDAVYNDGDVTMNVDGTLTVNTTGVYRASVSAIWRDNSDGQSDLRLYGVGHGVAGQKPGNYVPGKLTKMVGKFDRLGQYDVVSSNAPRTTQYQGAWKPGLIAKGAIATIDVVMPDAGVVTVGDVAMASHTRINDAALGAKAVAALMISAKVIAPDTVRVSIYNPTIGGSDGNGINISVGQLQIVALTSTAVSGSAVYSRMVMTSGLERLAKGDTLWGYFRSKALNDTLRADDQTFLHIERWN